MAVSDSVDGEALVSRDGHYSLRLNPGVSFPVFLEIVSADPFRPASVVVASPDLQVDFVLVRSPRL